MAEHLPGGYVLDPADPRAPTEEQWAAMSEAERDRVVAMLPSEFEGEINGEYVRCSAKASRAMALVMRAVEMQERARIAQLRTAELERRLREAEEEIARLRGERQ